MTFPEEPERKTITFTHSAAKAVQDVMSKKNLQGFALRLCISGGGCSSYQYSLLLDNNTNADDVITETDGIKLLVDQVSLHFLQGATVDYVEGLTSSGFKITNPNAISTCDCGQSFQSKASEGSDSPGDCPGCG